MQLLRAVPADDRVAQARRHAADLRRQCKQEAGLIAALRGAIELAVGDRRRTDQMHEQQACRECRLARLPTDRNDAAPRPVHVVVSLQDRVALPWHQLNRLTDQCALGDTAVRFDPGDDFLPKGWPLVVGGWRVRILRHRYFPPLPTATLRKPRCTSAAIRCTRPGPRVSGG